ncbi:MAG: sensor histidine kinase [Candidatus Omnitrophota bacterium]
MAIKTCVHQKLLMVLSKAAISVQESHTDADVYGAVGNAIAELGFSCFIFSYEENSMRLVLLYSNLEREKLEMAEGLTGVASQDFSLDLTRESIYSQSLFEHRALFFDQRINPVYDFLPGLPSPIAQKVYGLLGIEQMIHVPFSVANTNRGLLIVTGKGLSKEDIPVMTIFATQTAIALEINERRLIDQRLAEALELNQKIIEASNVGISVFKASGPSIFVNESIARILGTSVEEVLKKNFRQIVPWQKTGMLKLAEEALTERVGKRGEFFLKTEFNTEVGLDCYFTPLTIGGESHLLLLASDITERKYAERELNLYATQLERSNRELQDFAFIASHDLQEPLRKIQSFGELLKTKFSQFLPGDGSDYIDRMSNAATRMRSLIDDLLAYSRVTTKNHPFVNVNLNLILADVISDLEVRLKDCGGKVESGKLSVVYADPTQMHQLLQNLISNALKFKKPDVPPVVAIYARFVEGRDSEKCTQLCVQDNGIGFDEKYLDRIFMPFQRLHARTTYEGSGMGLAICRKIAERHHGTITAKSTPGQGATFIVTLPLEQKKF